MIARLLASIAIGLFAAHPALAEAQIPLRIRAESRLELRVESDRAASGSRDAVTSREGEVGAIAAREVVLRGHLRDDLGAPLAARRVEIAISDAPAEVPAYRTVTTDRDGAFVAHLPQSPTEYVVRASFAGDAEHDAVDAERSIRAGLEDVHLRLAVPARGVFDLDARVHPVTVVARGPAGPVEVEVELLDELGRRLGRGRTNALGRIRFELTADLLGATGAGRLVARSEADPRHAPAQTEVPIVRVRPTRLELDARPRAAPPGATITLEGRLYSSAEAQAQKAVDLFAGDRLVATVLTGADGSFHAEVPLPNADAASIAFIARYEPNDPGGAPSASTPREVRIDAPSVYQPALRFAPPIVALALLALGAASTRRRRRRAAGVERPSPPSRSPFGSKVRVLRGVVVSTTDARPLEAARVHYVDAAGREGEAFTDASGRFELPELAPGPVTIVAGLEGFQDASAQPVLPIRARDAELTLSLTELRAAALASYRALVTPWLDAPESWPWTTNRDAAACAPDPRRPKADELAAEIDRIYYGPDTADPEEVERFLRAAELRSTDTSSDHPLR
jgi:hypothetical protein